MLFIFTTISAKHGRLACRFCNHKRCSTCKKEPYKQSTRRRYEDAIEQECGPCGHPNCIPERRATTGKVNSSSRQECQWCGHENCVPRRRVPSKAIQSPPLTNIISSGPSGTGSPQISSTYSLLISDARPSPSIDPSYDLHESTRVDSGNQTKIAAPSSSVSSDTNPANARQSAKAAIGLVISPLTNRLNSLLRPLLVLVLLTALFKLVAPPMVAQFIHPEHLHLLLLVLLLIGLTLPMALYEAVIILVKPPITSLEHPDLQVLLLNRALLLLHFDLQVLLFNSLLLLLYFDL